MFNFIFTLFSLFDEEVVESDEEVSEEEQQEGEEEEINEEEEEESESDEESEQDEEEEPEEEQQSVQELQEKLKSVEAVLEKVQQELVSTKSSTNKRIGKMTAEKYELEARVREYESSSKETKLKTAENALAELEIKRQEAIAEGDAEAAYRIGEKKTEAQNQLKKLQEEKNRDLYNGFLDSSRRFSSSAEEIAKLHPEIVSEETGAIDINNPVIKRTTEKLLQNKAESKKLYDMQTYKPLMINPRYDSADGFKLAYYESQCEVSNEKIKELESEIGKQKKITSKMKKKASPARGKGSGITGSGEETIESLRKKMAEQEKNKDVIGFTRTRLAIEEALSKRK